MSRHPDGGVRAVTRLTVGAGALATAAHLVVVLALEGTEGAVAVTTAWAIAGTAAAWAVTVAARRIADERRRRAVSLVALALALWALGSLIRFGFALAGSTALVPVADLLWCAFAVTMTAALVARAPPQALSIRLFALDAVPVGLLAIQVARVVSGTGFHAPLADQAFIVAYASAYVLMGVVAAQLIVIERRRDAPLYLLGGGALLLGAAGFAWSFEALAAEPTGNVTDFLWTAGVLVVAGGALLRARSPEIAPAVASSTDSAMRTVPPALALLSLIFLHDAVSEERFPLGIWFTVAAFLAFAARYYIARRDSRALLERESEARAAAERADRLKDDFLALVSHELRTPLTSIRGYLELVLDEPDELNEEQLRFLRTVERNSDRLLRLVSDLLFVAQIESRDLLITHERVALDQLAEESVGAALPAAEAAGVSLEVRARSRTEVKGDPTRLGQLLDNLVSNALKFTPPGGDVLVRTLRDGDWAVIEVSDTGMGIPEEEQAQLFERFFRASSTTAQAIQGTGLGLTIARAIAEAHDGGIDFESTVGEGSVFRVRLPLGYEEGR